MEWLAAQGWTNGKIGTVGASCDGRIQFLTALALPPHLVTMIANVPDAGPFHHFPYEYAVFFTYGAFSWLESLGAGMLRQDPSWLSRLDTLPVADLMKRLSGKENEIYRRWIEHNSRDAYWEKADYLDRLDKLKIPVFLQGGWFDTSTNGVRLAYQKLQDAGNKDIGMIVGPWAHSAKSSTTLGGMDFGEAAGINLYQLYGRWFDYWLKGIDNGIVREPGVQLFLMGPNRWLRGDSYPLHRTVMTEFYLSSDTGANTMKGDGRLQRHKPASGREFDSASRTEWTDLLLRMPWTSAEWQDFSGLDVKQPLVRGLGGLNEFRAGAARGIDEADAVILAGHAAGDRFIGSLEPVGPHCIGER